MTKTLKQAAAVATLALVAMGAPDEAKANCQSTNNQPCPKVDAPDANAQASARGGEGGSVSIRNRRNIPSGTAVTGTGPIGGKTKSFMVPGFYQSTTYTPDPVALAERARAESMAARCGRGVDLTTDTLNTKIELEANRTFGNLSDGTKRDLQTVMLTGWREARASCPGLAETAETVSTEMSDCANVGNVLGLDGTCQAAPSSATKPREAEVAVRADLEAQRVANAQLRAQLTAAQDRAKASDQATADFNKNLAAYRNWLETSASRHSACPRGTVFRTVEVIEANKDQVQQRINEIVESGCYGTGRFGTEEGVRYQYTQTFRTNIDPVRKGAEMGLWQLNK